MSYYIDGRNVASNHTQPTKTKGRHGKVTENVNRQVIEINQTRNSKMSKQSTVHQCKIVIYL
jgi:hypothetical protein